MGHRFHSPRPEKEGQAHEEAKAYSNRFHRPITLPDSYCRVCLCSSQVQRNAGRQRGLPQQPEQHELSIPINACKREQSTCYYH